MIKHIIASGCSFTSNGLGGLPPSPAHPVGGCSYTADESFTPSEPQSWAGIVAQKLQVSSFVNTAVESHGNILIANNILTLLQRFKYNPAETLVLFNISDPGRFDIMCDWEHPTQCKFLNNWQQDIIPFKYLDNKSKIVETCIKNTGIDQVEIITSNMLLGMMSYLKQNNFNFYFLLMKDYTTHPALASVINQFREHLITLNPGIGMYEFGKELNLLSEDNFHLSINGNKKVADCVLNNIKQ